LISITGNDLSKDGDVTVVIQRAIDHAVIAGNGQVQRDMTFEPRPDPRSHNVYRGALKAGVVTTRSPVDFRMLANPSWEGDYRLYGSRLRLTLKPDGSLEGIVGGYRPWRDVYRAYAIVGNAIEHGTSVDVIGVYYALRRLADGLPNPKTGMNDGISAAYRIDAVPAFVVATSQPQ
jgi:hypothetical protein